MKLIIFVNKFDEKDDLLGFFVGWVRELSGGLEKITVVTQKEGEYDKLTNVDVISINKEENKNPFVRVLKFLSLLLRLRNDFDGILVVMAPAWSIISSIISKLLGKRSYLWYAVWRGSFKLRLAETFVDKIFCSVEETFPFKTKKLFPIGQGIDTEYFTPNFSAQSQGKILFLGRISPVKKIEVFLRSLALLLKMDNDSLGRKEIRVNVVGAPVSEKDKNYLSEMRKLENELGLRERISWPGRIPHNEVRRFYQEAGIFVNLTPTGSFDKTILEAMACGNLVVVSNKALTKFFNLSLQELLIFKENDDNDLAHKLCNLLKLETHKKLGLRDELRNIVIKNHSQKQWAKNFLQAIAR